MATESMRSGLQTVRSKPAWLALLIFLMTFLGYLATAPEPVSATSTKLALNTGMVTNETGNGNPALLFDEQATAGNPRGGSGGSPTTIWNPGTGVTNAAAYINLGQLHDITDIYLYDANNVGAFKVFRGSPGNWTEIINFSTNQYLQWRSFEFTTAVQTQYLRFVKVDNAANISEVVVYGSAAGGGGGGGDTTPPANVTNLSVSNKTSNSVQLNWTAPGDDGNAGTASSYDIRYSTATINSGNWASATPVSGAPAPAANGTNQSVTVSGLAANTTYYFALRTSDEVPNVSGLSNVVSEKTNPGSGGTGKPGRILNLTGTGTTSSSATLTWTAPGRVDSSGTASSYEIRYSETVITESTWNNAIPFGSPPAPAVSGTTQTVTITGMNQLTTYYVAIKATNDLNNESWVSNNAIVSTAANGSDTSPPANITNLSILNDATNEPYNVTSFYVRLTWTAPNDNKGKSAEYDIRYSTSNITNDTQWRNATPVAFEPKPGTPGSAESMTVYDLAPNTMYYFAIKTIDKAGNVSGLSNIASKQTEALVCDVTISSGPLNGNNTPVTPGQTACISAGSRGALNVMHIQGTAEKPILITNHGGQVNITSTSYGIKVENSKHIRLSGRGSTSHQYGFNIQMGVQLKGNSTNYIVENVATTGGNVGFNAKSDITCGVSDYDSFIQYNTVLRSNKIASSSGNPGASEGFYVGDSHLHYGIKTSSRGPCGAYEQTYPHMLIGVRVYDNDVEGTTKDGIQVGAAIEDVEVYDNYIHNFATSGISGDNGGIQINPGTSGRIYNNKIIGPTAADKISKGIELQGRGNLHVYNNEISNVTSAGMFIDDRTSAELPWIFTNEGIHIINNTIVMNRTMSGNPNPPSMYGLQIYNELVRGNTIYNNIIVNTVPNFTPVYFVHASPSHWDQQDNLISSTPSSVGFTNFSGGNFTLTSGSPAVNTGRNVSAFGVTYDFNRVLRPQGGGYDKGAYER